METRSNPNCNRLRSRGEMAMAKRSCAPVFNLLVVLILTTGGCGQSGPAMAPAKGRVTLDGQAVADAAVAFMPVGGGPLATGNTDSQGVFELQTTNKPGAVLGEHTVTITKMRELGYNPDGTVGPGGIRTQWIVPQKYSLPASSGLTASVGKGDVEHVFELSSK